MELNRDQIIKALECCGVGGEIRNCTPSSCPYYSIPLEDIEDCCDVLARDALALIKELTVEAEALRGAANSYKMHYENVKSDTLRNMRTQVNNKAVFPDGTREHAYITLKVFDGIVEEMLKNKK